MTADVRVRLPAFARAFGDSEHDEVRFDSLKPLAAGSPWSAIAVICPRDADASGGIVGQRRAGSNAFTLALRDGAIAAECGALSRVSNLSPPVKEWSRIGVACAADGMRFYLGHGGVATCADGLGLPAGVSAAEAPVVIGRAGATFPGSIAVVCLFAEQLPDATMQAIVRGAVDPCFAPKLVFAWLAAGAGNIEIVSRRSAIVTGTRVVPVVAALPTRAKPGASSAPASSPSHAAVPAIAPASAPAPAAALASCAPQGASPSTSGPSLFDELGLDRPE